MEAKKCTFLDLFCLSLSRHDRWQPRSELFYKPLPLKFIPIIPTVADSWEVHFFNIFSARVYSESRRQFVAIVADIN